MSLILKNLYSINNEVTKLKRTLLNDIENIYFSLPCVSGCEYVNCGDNELCKRIKYLLKSLKKFY